ncbi:MAG TPA: choline dehydrogenase [Stellaceae bacterium]|jgi:choline dehydrogenase-like flavoprotein|nr:choline dehydrogenase [Stellaceae bacterium]
MATGENTFDYIIVGAGSAGCVLANRLSADPNVSVALIEAGPSDHKLPVKWLVDIPAGISGLIANPRYNWSYLYETDARLGNRAIPCPRGRVMGGTSAINGMVYIRGNRNDFDGWAAKGCEGWNYDSVLPYFKKSENYQYGASDYHGAGGELSVEDQRDPNPVGQIALEAATQLQHRRTPDFNAAEQDGFGFWQVTQKRGARASTARAFLDPVRHRPNLTVIPNALTERIDLEGKRAVGITVRRKDGGTPILKARREVIVSGGAINSPQLLLLSGIGPAADLQGFGVAVHHDLPGVGENLHDHQGIFMTWSSPDTRLYGLSSGSVSWLAASPFRYFFERKGAWTTNTCEAGGFVRSLPNLDQPDLQLFFFPQYMNQPQHFIPRGHGFSWHVSLLQPKSRGKLTLKTTRPDDAPRLISGFLTHDDDLAGIVRGFKEVRRIVDAPAMEKYRGVELDPGPSVQTDDQIADFIRANLGTTYHPAGTCKMGTDAMAVVDPQLRVHGLQGLRVIDASVMPQVTSGNTNAPTIMIAERGADLIKAQWAN